VGKRVAITLLVLLIAGLSILGYFFQQSKKSIFTDPFKAISQGACVVIEIVDLQSFMNSLTTGKGLFGEVGKIREFGSFDQKLKFLTDLINKAEIVKLLNSGSAAIISFQPDKAGKLRTLFSMTISGEIRYRHIKEALHSLGIMNATDSKLDGNAVLKIPYSVNDLNDTAYISIISGLMLCSSSAELIKDAYTQINKGIDVRILPGFSRVLMASGKNENKIFVVFANLYQFIKPVMGLDRHGLAEKSAKLAGTAGGDIYLNEDGLVLSGYTESTDSSDYLYKYKFIPPREFHTNKILPSSTVLFETVVIPVSVTKNKTNTSFSPQTVDFARKLKEYSGEEITRAYIDNKERPVDENSLIILELNNRIRAEQLFLDEAGKGNEIIYFEPDDQIKIPVYKAPFKGLTMIMMPGFAPDFEELYFAFYDNFMLTGNSIATISGLLYDNLLNKTLANDLTYRDFESTLPSRAGYLFYCVPSQITGYLTGFLNDEIIKALNSNKESISKIQAAGYQFASSNGMLYNSLSVRYKEVAREESTTEWETLLDTVASIKPFFFTNHNTGAREIFIQDMNNNTYLINSAGRVLWKVPLKEKIIGNVYMIDYYRNGKYQLLFSGKYQIHLLDRNGNYVERYPVKLRSPATNSLSLFDYDNNLNYRLFIAGEDKLIYSYDKTGNVVKDWKPFRTNSYVEAEVSYFKVSGKDYIVTSDDNSIYLLDRKGNKKITLKESVTKAGGSTLRLNPGSDPFLVCSSPEGTVQNIYFDGSVKKFTLKKFSIDHTFDNFDVDGDGFGEYIFIDKGMLYLYDHNRSEMFSRDFGSADLGGPINFIFSASDRKIGVFDVNKKLIYLIGKNGETMNGFPLRGASMFSIGKLSGKSGWHLIVGGTDRFLYNYKIDTGIKYE
jgi:WD40 repeat protein